MVPKPRVLVLTCHLPYPPISGGRRRELELFRRVADYCELHLCAISKTPAEDAANASQLEQVFESIQVFAADGDGAAGACSQLARHGCPQAGAYVANATASGAFDVLHVEGFYLMQHIGVTAVPLVLVEQNVEFELWRQRAETASSELERRRMLRQYQVARRAEVEAWAAASLCAAITPEDAALMETTLPGLRVALAPDGVDHLCPPAKDREPVAPNEIVFVGNFAYAPNVDAAQHLVGEVLPRIAERVPDVHLTLVGNEPPDDLRDGPGCSVTGRVPDVRPYLDRAAVVACPLRVGGGIKVKVLEALRHGKATVTTSVGAQGLRAGSGTAFVVADHANEFATEVVRLLEDPTRRRRLERAAANFAETLPTWDDGAEALMRCYDACRTAAVSMPAK